MKNNSRKLLFSLLLPALLVFGLSGCAGKRTKEIYGPGYPPPPESAGKLDLPEPESGLPLGIPEPTKPPTPSVSLVVGGTGVASFATVGILKRLREEGIKVDFIVTSGWPTVFSLGYGFLRSVHDLEWFAMRLDESDFRRAGFFKNSDPTVSKKIQSALKPKYLDELKTPVIISSINPESGDVEISDRGEWRDGLLLAMVSAPMVDIREALRRDARVVVGVQMYDDFFSTEAAAQDPKMAALRKTINDEMKQAHIRGRIVLGRSPNDFASKRAAILAGYKEATRLAKLLRGNVGNIRTESP